MARRILKIRRQRGVRVALPETILNSLARSKVLESRTFFGRISGTAIHRVFGQIAGP